MRFWPFSRRPKPQAPQDCRCMNEDWRVGDLARCISDDWNEAEAANPRVGETLRVAAVKQGVTARNRLVYGLAFEGKPPLWLWESTSFRKLRPSLRACEDPFRVWLRDKIKPRVDA